MIKKILVVKSFDKEEINPKGLLSLECEDEIKGKLKMFDNLKNACLVLKIGENILIFDIQDTENFELKTVFHCLDLPIGCLILRNSKIVAYAKSDNFLDDVETLYECYDVYVKQQKNIDVQSFAKIKQEKVEKNVKNDVKNEKNTKIIEKSKKKEEKKDNLLSEKIDETTNFFEEIKDQFDELFLKNERFTELEGKLNNTKWVKIFCASEFSNHYILGKIFEDEKLKYICYGMASESEEKFPDGDLKNYCQWLPFEIDEKKGSGYWLVYQDAKTGENVFV